MLPDRLANFYPQSFQSADHSVGVWSNPLKLTHQYHMTILYMHGM